MSKFRIFYSCWCTCTYAYARLYQSEYICTVGYVVNHYALDKMRFLDLYNIFLFFLFFRNLNLKIISVMFSFRNLRTKMKTITLREMCVRPTPQYNQKYGESKRTIEKGASIIVGIDTYRYLPKTYGDYVQQKEVN